MSNSRVVTVRLPPEQVTNLETVARFDGVAMAELLRAGVELLLQERRNDPEFRRRVESAYGEAQRLLGDVPGAEDVLSVVSRSFEDGSAPPVPATHTQAANGASIAAGSARDDVQMSR